MGRSGTAAVVRVLGFFLTGTFAVLQVLDVLMERLGIPQRVFVQVTVGAVLLLPAAVAAGVLKGVSDDDETSSGLKQRTRGREPVARRMDAAHVAAPGAAHVPDPATAHYRLAVLYDARGDSERAIHHYSRYIALSEAAGNVQDMPSAPAAGALPRHLDASR